MLPDQSITHIVGIGGIGMSAIAKMMKNLGYAVQGSDIKKNKRTKILQKLGIKIFFEHKAENISFCTLLARSSAIKDGNIEIIAARKLGILVFSRAQLLAELLKDKFNICVTGAHGKTSTTALIYQMLLSHSPSVICGGIINSIDNNVAFGNSNIFVVESDESDGTFLTLPTNVAVITNIDKEHLDYYQSFDAMLLAYKAFITKVLETGIVILCIDCPYLASFNQDFEGRENYITYAIDKKADLQAVNLRYKGADVLMNIYVSGKLRNYFGREEFCLRDFQIPNGARHKISNSLAAIAVGLYKRMEVDEIRKITAITAGVKRRFTLIKEINGIKYIDDYAHHPQEIVATIETAKLQLQNQGKIIIVFQPHKYSRFKELYSDFIRVMKSLDFIILMDIYAAQEKNKENINIDSFITDLQNESSLDVYYGKNIKIIKDLLVKHQQTDDIVVFMGAGDISEIAYKIVEEIAF